MKINKFNGGLNTRLDPSLLDPSEATILTNIDTTALTLKSSLGLTDINKEARGFFYLFKDTWIGSYLARSYVEYGDKLYFTEQDSAAKFFDGSRTVNMGIIGPIESLIASEPGATALTVLEAPATATFEDVLNIAPQSASATSMYITPNGFTLYVLDSASNSIDMYDLATAWDITTAVYATKTFSVAAQDTAATGITFRPDGSKLYLVGNNRVIYEYVLATAWDITTATYSTNISIVAQTTSPQGLQLSSDGTKVFIVDDTATDKIVMYTLSTPYLMSSATYTNSANITIDASPRGLFLNASGTRLYVVGVSADKVYEYVLTVAWNITTIVYHGELADISIQTSNATDVFFSPDLLHMYIIGEPTIAEIDQYKVNRISSADSTIQYVYTYYNSTDGIESTPSEPSAELSLPAVRSTTVSGFLVSSDPQVDKIRLYRIGDSVTEFELVAEIPSNSTTYTDGVPTTELTLIMDTDNNYPPEVGTSFLVEAHGTFFCAKGNKLFFSLPGKPTYWPKAYYITVNQNITGLLPYPDGLLVFGETRTDIIYGTSVADFSKAPVSENIGCTSHYSCKYTKSIPIWSSLEGLCTIQAGSPVVLTKDKLGLQQFNIVNSAIYDETYWACLADGTVLAVDYRFGGLAFKKYSFPSPLLNIYSKGTLYGVIATDKLVTLLTGEPLVVLYKSPVFVEDAYSETKLYDNVYVKFNGTFTLSILIDDVVVSSYDLSGNEYRELLVPENKQRGNSIQFIVEGTGTFHEIEYKVQGRQNGR